jgi:hypothetical protein
LCCPTADSQVINDHCHAKADGGTKHGTKKKKKPKNAGNSRPKIALNDSING